MGFCYEWWIFSPENIHRIFVNTSTMDRTVPAWANRFFLCLVRRWNDHFGKTHTPAKLGAFSTKDTCFLQLPLWLRDFYGSWKRRENQTVSNRKMFWRYLPPCPSPAKKKHFQLNLGLDFPQTQSTYLFGGINSLRRVAILTELNLLGRG